MSFQEEMRTAYTLSHDTDALAHRAEPEAHDYEGAEAYLAEIKESIRAGLRSAPEARAAGHVTLGTLPLGEGPSRPEDFVLVDRTEQPDGGLLHQTVGAYLTRRGYVLIRDLKELAAREGIDLTFALEYQGGRTPLDGDGVGTCYRLPHTNRLTESLPRVRAEFDYRV